MTKKGLSFQNDSDGQPSECDLLIFCPHSCVPAMMNVMVSEGLRRSLKEEHTHLLLNCYAEASRDARQS